MLRRLFCFQQSHCLKRYRYLAAVSQTETGRSFIRSLQVLQVQARVARAPASKSGATASRKTTTTSGASSVSAVCISAGGRWEGFAECKEQATLKAMQDCWQLPNCLVSNDTVSKRSGESVRLRVDHRGLQWCPQQLERQVFL